MATSTNDVRTLQSQASGVASPSVRVNVGSSPDDKVFFVHQDLICSRSGFFENAMKESEKEVPEPKVDLSEEKPDTFALYLELIYTGTLPIKGDHHDFVLLSRVYALAEKLKDDTTKDMVLVTMHTKSKEPSADRRSGFPGLVSINTIYSGTPRNSPAHRFLVDLYTEFADSSFNLTAYADAHKEFLYDMLVRLVATRPRAKVSTELRAELATEKAESKAKDDQVAERDVMLVNLRSENTTLKAMVQSLTTERDTARKNLDAYKCKRRARKFGNSGWVSESTAGADGE